MIARICESCELTISTEESLEIMMSVIDPSEGVDQDKKQTVYGDFCETCIASGAAIKKLLTRLDWTLELSDSTKDNQ